MADASQNGELQEVIRNGMDACSNRYYCCHPEPLLRRILAFKQLRSNPSFFFNYSYFLSVSEEFFCLS